MDDILLDTNVVSELVKPRPDPNVIAFLRDSARPWLCTITLHELVYGAERAPDSRRRGKLLAWVAQVTAEFADRTIAVDNTAAEHSGRLRALAEEQGRPTTVIDAIIAAAAQLQGLTLVTRNTRDFEPFGVALFNPWIDAN
jgi:predicted nucleic acid-binding protein